MSNVSTKKVYIQIESPAEQQEHLKKNRQTLKVLQGVATDKENLAGRPQIDKLSRLKAQTEASLASSELSKRKKIETRSSETQTSPQKQQITASDLTSNSAPTEFYWERLADKRREALEESLVENQKLHERIDGLEEELNLSRSMLEEARNLVEVLTEMLNENEAEQEIKNDETSTPEEEEGVEASSSDKEQQNNTTPTK